jgi:hypothetical protein
MRLSEIYDASQEYDPAWDEDGEACPGCEQISVLFECEECKNLGRVNTHYCTGCLREHDDDYHAEMAWEAFENALAEAYNIFPYAGDDLLLLLGEACDG